MPPSGSSSACGRSSNGEAMWRRSLWVVVPPLLVVGMLLGSREYERLNTIESDVAKMKADLDPSRPGFRRDVLMSLERLEHCCCAVAP